MACNCKNTCDHDFVDFRTLGAVTPDVHLKPCELVAYTVPTEPNLANNTLLILRNGSKILVAEDQHKVGQIIKKGMLGLASIGGGD